MDDNEFVVDPNIVVKKKLNYKKIKKSAKLPTGAIDKNKFSIFGEVLEKKKKEGAGPDDDDDIETELQHLLLKNKQKRNLKSQLPKDLSESEEKNDLPTVAVKEKEIPQEEQEVLQPVEEAIDVDDTSSIASTHSKTDSLLRRLTVKKKEKKSVARLLPGSLNPNKLAKFGSYNPDLIRQRSAPGSYCGEDEEDKGKDRNEEEEVNDKISTQNKIVLDQYEISNKEKIKQWMLQQESIDQEGDDEEKTISSLKQVDGLEEVASVRDYGGDGGQDDDESQHVLKSRYKPEKLSVGKLQAKPLAVKQMRKKEQKKPGTLKIGNLSKFASIQGAKKNVKMNQERKMVGELISGKLSKFKSAEEEPSRGLKFEDAADSSDGSNTISEQNLLLDSSTKQKNEYESITEELQQRAKYETSIKVTELQERVEYESSKETTDLQERVEYGSSKEVTELQEAVDYETNRKTAELQKKPIHSRERRTENTLSFKPTQSLMKNDERKQTSDIIQQVSAMENIALMKEEQKTNEILIVSEEPEEDEVNINKSCNDYVSNVSNEHTYKNKRKVEDDYSINQDKREHTKDDDLKSKATYNNDMLDNIATSCQVEIEEEEGEEEKEEDVCSSNRKNIGQNESSYNSKKLTSNQVAIKNNTNSTKDDSTIRTAQDQNKNKHISYNLDGLQTQQEYLQRKETSRICTEKEEEQEEQERKDRKGKAGREETGKQVDQFRNSKVLPKDSSISNQNLDDLKIGKGINEINDIKANNQLPVQKIENQFNSQVSDKRVSSHLTKRRQTEALRKNLKKCKSIDNHEWSLLLAGEQVLADQDDPRNFAFVVDIESIALEEFSTSCQWLLVARGVETPSDVHNEWVSMAQGSDIMNKSINDIDLLSTNKMKTIVEETPLKERKQNKFYQIKNRNTWDRDNLPIQRQEILQKKPKYDFHKYDHWLMNFCTSGEAKCDSKVKRENSKYNLSDSCHHIMYCVRNMSDSVEYERRSKHFVNLIF